MFWVHLKLFSSMKCFLKLGSEKDYKQYIECSFSRDVEIHFEIKNFKHIRTHTPYIKTHPSF